MCLHIYEQRANSLMVNHPNNRLYLIKPNSNYRLAHIIQLKQNELVHLTISTNKVTTIYYN